MDVFYIFTDGLKPKRIWFESFIFYKDNRSEGVESGSAGRCSLKGRERAVHRHSDEHWNCFKGNVGRTSERQDVANNNYGLFRVHRYHLEWN